MGGIGSASTEAGNGNGRLAPLAAPGSRRFAEVLRRVEREEGPQFLTAARKRLSERLDPEDRSLRALRLRAGLSQSDLARAIGTSQPRIARLEAGRESPGLDLLRRLRDVLKVDMNTLDAAF